MAGKNKVERSFRFKFNSQDLSGDLIPGSCQGGGFSYDQADMTGVSDGAKNYLASWPDAPISAQFHVNDTGTTGSHTVLSAKLGQSAALELDWGASGAAPTTGDIKWTGTYTLIEYNLQFNGGKAVAACKFLPTAGSAAPAFGTL